MRSALRTPPFAACDGTSRTIGAKYALQVRLCGRAEKLFGDRPISRKKEAGLQIISIKGFGKFGEILEVAGLRARFPSSFQ